MLDPSSLEKGLSITTVAAIVNEIASSFKAAGIPTPALDAKRLVGFVTGLTREELLTRSDLQLSSEQLSMLRSFHERRLNHEPVSRIIGCRAFYGRDFKVTVATLDPRPETELLVDQALAYVCARGLEDAPLDILDVGTGSGALLVTLLRELPRACGTGTDISADALAVASDNAARHGVRDRAKFLEMDGTASLQGPFDIMLSNPPYIASHEIERLDPGVKNFDPRLALDGGADGLLHYRRMALDLERLVPKGLVAVEVGAGQAGQVGEIFRAAMPPQKRPRLSIKRDLGGHERCVALLTQS